MYVQYSNPAAYPPLEHSSQVVADAGWSVLMLGAIRTEARSLRVRPHPRVNERYLYSDATGWRLKLHYFHFVLWVLGWTLRWRPEWIYASDILACPVAVLLSFVPGLQVLYHEHDEPARRPCLSGRLQAALRRAIAARASIRVLPNEERARFFEATVSGGRPVITVWNCPRLGEVRLDGRSAYSGPLRVVYSGAITPDRVPLALVAALKATPTRVVLRLVGYETIGAPGYKRAIQQRAQELGVADQIELMEPMPRHQLRRMWDEADVGLALRPLRALDNNDRWLVGASNKAFEYMAAGLVLLVPEKPDWCATFVESGYGLACKPDDASSVANALHWLATHPAERLAMGQRAQRQIASTWNYETQFRPVLLQLTNGRKH